MDVDKFISYQIEKQFPAIYREDGRELVEFVKAYYEFLETTPNQSIYNNRRLFEYGDIDNTLSELLLFYRNKFLADLPFDETNIRFIVKNILDLYRRKGTEEGLILFFRMFYQENINIYYPSEDILKPSASSWTIGRYIELYPSDPESVAQLNSSKGLQIYGSISKASAIVDRIGYVIIQNTLMPIIFLYNVKGNFVGFDEIFIEGGTFIGRVRGSLQSADTFSKQRGSAGNRIGDIVQIDSETGIGAKGRVNDVTTELSGEISFSIEDGGFGYTIENTDIIISDQTIFPSSNADRTLERLERIVQPVTGASGYIVGQNNFGIGIKVDDANTAFEATYPVETVDRVENVSLDILFVSPFNQSAYAEAGELSNIENISIYTDIVGDFLDVGLDATNYSAPPALQPMTGNAPFGTPPIDINTKLKDAFVPQDFEIGTISRLKSVDPGTDYESSVFILAEDSIISKFGLYEQIIKYDGTTQVNFLEGDIITQGDTRGIIRQKIGNDIKVQQLSFQGFVTGSPIYKENLNIPVDVINVERDFSTLPLGYNAKIDGDVIDRVGKIVEVDVFDSGIGFLDNEQVTMFNETKLDRLQRAYDADPSQDNLDALELAQEETSAVAIGRARGQGVTQGIWETKTSHLNSKKYIQDSDFYQDYSYRISSKLNPDVYLSSLKELAHVAGTKVFHKFNVEESINSQTNITDEIVFYNIVEKDLSTQDSNILGTEDDIISTIVYEEIEV